MHGNPRKGQSDKLDINQLLEPQGLPFNWRSNRGNYIKEREQALSRRIGFTSCFLCNCYHHSFYMCSSYRFSSALSRQGTDSTLGSGDVFCSKMREEGIVSNCFHSHYNAVNDGWGEPVVSAALLLTHTLYYSIKCS